MQRPVFRYIVLPGTHPPMGLRSAYAEAYWLWRRVWSQTFQELDGLKSLFSDDFIRQDQIGCIFRDDLCIALVFFRDLDFTLPSARHDSYFKCWKESDIIGLLKDGPKVMVGSYITVHPEFRGSLQNGIRLKSTLLQLSIKSLLASDCDVMTGITRCDRGINTVAFDLGAQLLSKDVVYHGVPTDLVAWYRRDLSQKRLPMDLFTERLWMERNAGTPSQSKQRKTA
jgi:hypothetical protein